MEIAMPLVVGGLAGLSVATACGAEPRVPRMPLAELERFVNGQVEAMIDEILSGATAPNPIDRGPSDSECKYCDFSSACHKDVCGVNARRFASVTPEEFWQALERRLEHG